MEVKGFGLKVSGTYSTSILDLDEKGRSDGVEVFPAPGVIFLEKVHTNSDGLRVVIERKYHNDYPSILIWTDELHKMYSVANTLDTLRRRLSSNNEALNKELRSWIV